MRLAVKTGDWNPTPDEWQRASSFLGACEPSEMERIMRLKIEEDRKRSLIGRLLLRYAGSTYTGLAPSELHMIRTPQNRPICSDIAGKADVNISHHGDWVVLASDEQRSIGVDVMKFEQPRRGVEAFFTSMRRQFTDDEWEQIGGSLERFYQFWALKESYIKAVGIGLGFNLQRASFRFVDSTTAQVKIDGELKNDWDFQVVQLDSVHCVATALGPVIHKSDDQTSPPSTPEVIQFQSLSPADLFLKLSL